jgi:nicotinate-nucleotide pyrophosphorylase (carboxylating)
MESQFQMKPESYEQALRIAVRKALAEDLPSGHDVTCDCLVPADADGSGIISARQPGVLAAVGVGPVVIAELQAELSWQPFLADGDSLAAGTQIAKLEGSARALLMAERTVLNILSHLSGIATLTRQFVDAVSHTKCHIYDTRKTLPGLRTLQKYAVRCGGGKNHRQSLSDAILIKDNHLQLGAMGPLATQFSPSQAVKMAQAYRKTHLASASDMFIEIEVTTLEQLIEVLPESPDIVLLDNMSATQLRVAASLRNERAPHVVLEASGGVNLATVREIAESGIERISVGAITHSAPTLDLGLDW